MPPEQTGVANAMNTNLRGIGGAVGAAVVSSLITAHLQPNGYPYRSGYTIGWIVLAGVGRGRRAVTFALPGKTAAIDAARGGSLDTVRAGHRNG